MNDEILAATLNRIENTLNSVSMGLATNTQITKNHTEVLTEIREQVQKTNGRVTSLEATQATLAKVSSQNSGIIVDIQDRLQKEEDAGERQGIEINRLTKSDSERSEFSTKTKLMELDTREKVKLSFFAMLIGSIGTSLVLLLEWVKELFK